MRPCKCKFVDGALCNSPKGFCHHSQHTLDTLGCMYLSWPEHNVQQQEIHISDIRTFKDCRVKWKLTSPLGYHLEPKVQRKALWLGSGVHYALGKYYGGGRAFQELMQAWNEWVESEQDRLSGMDGVDREDMEGSIALGGNMLRHYYVWAQEHDNFEVVASEVRIRVPLPELGDDVFFVGTTDGLVKLPDGSYWLLEHKTAARLPEYRVLALDDQGPAYVWGVSQDPTFQGVRPKGVLFNFLVKKHTEEPNHLKNGELSKAKSVKVSAELYRYYIRKYGMDPEPYAGILDCLDRNESYFRRDPLIVTDARLEHMQRNLMHVAGDMLHDPMIYPSQNWSWFKCKICPFSMVCTLMLNGADINPLLRANFKKRPEHIINMDEEDE